MEKSSLFLDASQIWSFWMSIGLAIAFGWCFYISDKCWKSVMCSKIKTISINQNYAPWCGRGLLGMCGCRRDVPGWLGARTPPAVWDVLVEEALTTSSIFPSSLTNRVRMSSSSTAIVLFRSAVCIRGKKVNTTKNKNAVLFFPRWTNFIVHISFAGKKSDPPHIQSPALQTSSTYRNQPWRFPVAHLVHSGSPLSGPLHIADWARGSAHAARRCSDVEAAALCSAAAWGPMPGQIPTAARSAFGTCSSAGVHPAWYWGTVKGRGPLERPDGLVFDNEWFL